VSALSRTSNPRKRGKGKKGRAGGLVPRGHISTRGRAGAGWSIRLSIYRRDARVFIRFGASVPEKRGGRQAPKRGVITHWSDRSRRRARHVLRNAVAVWRAFLTLTYPAHFPTDGVTVKRHINAFLTWLRRRCPDLHYFWVLEFQGRGAPHIHMLLDCRIPKKELAERWYRIVGSGDPKHLRAGTRVEGVRSQGGVKAYFLSRYLGKSSQKEVPPGFESVGRFWGASHSLAPVLHNVVISGLTWNEVGRLLRRLRAYKVAQLRHLRRRIRWRWRGVGFLVPDGGRVYRGWPVALWLLHEAVERVFPGAASALTKPPSERRQGRSPEGVGSKNRPLPKRARGLAWSRVALSSRVRVLRGPGFGDGDETPDGVRG